MEILNENGRLTGDRDNRTRKETVIGQVKATGILPAMKLKKKADFMAWAQALYEGGARVIEITMTTPGVLEAIEAISSEFKGRLWVVSGTTLDATSAREVILHGGAGIVNPCIVPEVIDLGPPLRRAGLLRRVHRDRGLYGLARRGRRDQDLPGPARRPQVHDQPEDGLPRGGLVPLGRAEPGDRRRVHPLRRLRRQRGT